ncbi:hypothetical protein F5X96DRAFT_275504 [Biscogniauxia mediterranea]|nr:hypothetical protein F5X96DRAFT_275504 [Biscogniauxia mediterranea]
MSEEPTLPPTVAWDFETQTFTNTRKRTRDRAGASPLLFNSSDPAVFSSDDDPHVDNYSQGRHRKKRYVGSWFQQHLASSDSTFGEVARPRPTAKRTFKRQFDSGVWMGSDGSVDLDLEEDVNMEAEVPPEPELLLLRHARPAAAISTKEEIVRQKIQSAIDEGNEDIDLSSLGITSIQNATISQLSEFSCIPLVAEDVPFEQKDPSLKLYLYDNPLLRAPGALFNLDYLTVLSLRNTKITELPPSIGNLHNLQSLNLSLNRLRYLPAELLGLMKYPSKLEHLSIHPNPFYQPSSLPQLQDIVEETKGGQEDAGFALIHESTSSDGTIDRFWISTDDKIFGTMGYLSIDDREFSAWRATILGRSPVQYNDSRGAVLSKFRVPQQERTGSGSPISEGNITIELEDLTSSAAPARPNRDQSTWNTEPSRVFSLFELALQSCSRTGQLRELPSYLPPQTPAHFTRVLDRVAEQSEENANSGSVPCSVCKRGVMMPTAQWIEWWDLSVSVMNQKGPLKARLPLSSHPDERAVPFLRKGCSWKCVPRPMKFGQWLPGVVKWTREQPDEMV